MGIVELRGGVPYLRRRLDPDADTRCDWIRSRALTCAAGLKEDIQGQTGHRVWVHRRSSSSGATSPDSWLRPGNASSSTARPFTTGWRVDQTNSIRPRLRRSRPPSIGWPRRSRRWAPIGVHSGLEVKVNRRHPHSPDLGKQEAKRSRNLSLAVADRIEGLRRGTNQDGAFAPNRLALGHAVLSRFGSPIPATQR
jgi:hypothetical protein